MRNNGFTLLEALLAFGISSAVAVVLVGVLLNNSRVYTSQDNFVSAGVELNTTLSKISLDLREASEVALSYNEPPSITTLSDSSHIVLKLQALKVDGSVDLLKYDYVVIGAATANPKVLQERVYPDPSSTRAAGNKSLSPLLKSISFEYLDAASSPIAPDQAQRVKVTLSIESKSGQIGTKTTSSTTVSLRNSQ